jgi:hypothetical protein
MKIRVFRERQLAAEVPRFHGHASAAHVARPAFWFGSFELGILDARVPDHIRKGRKLEHDGLSMALLFHLNNWLI